MGFNDFTKLGIVFVFVFFLAVCTFCSGKQTLKWEVDVQIQSQSTKVGRVFVQVWADTLRETSSWLETGGHKSIQKLSKSIYILV